jgi:hypothetical protein
MLQRVALGQVRFNVPGLAVDARGVVGGRQLAVRLAAIDRLVSFFRVLSAEQNLDDLQPGLRIVYARGAAGTREAIVFLPASSAHTGDVIARAARLAGGQCFTGSSKHFVQFRDAGAPLGYDAAVASQETGDVILYGAEQDVAYRIDTELPLSKLLLRLSLQRQAAGGTAETEGTFYLVARRGLGPLVAEYLHRARMRGGRVGGVIGAGGAAGVLEAGEVREPGAVRLHAAVAICEVGARSAFSAGRAFWLFKLEGVPARMRGLLTGTPGLELFAPVTEHVAVAVGYRHPIALGSCRGSFSSDRLTLFSPRADGVMEIQPLPVLAAIEDVVHIRPPLARDPERVAARSTVRPEVAVPLRLEPTADPRRHAVGALVPWARVDWLRRLCYALPSTALRGYRVAVLQRGVLVLASAALEGFPFGVLLDAAAPDVLVPLGTRLRPAVSPELLAERVGAQGGALVVFPALGAPPFRVAADAVQPLDRRVLSLMKEAAIEPTAVNTEPPTVAAAVEIENDPLGPMPLWGLER